MDHGVYLKAHQMQTQGLDTFPDSYVTNYTHERDGGLGVGCFTHQDFRIKLSHVVYPVYREILPYRSPVPHIRQVSRLIEHL